MTLPTTEDSIDDEDSIDVVVKENGVGVGGGSGHSDEVYLNDDPGRLEELSENQYTRKKGVTKYGDALKTLIPIRCTGR